MDPRSADRDAARPTINDVAHSAGVSLRTGPSTTEVLPTRLIARGSGEVPA